MKDPSETKKEGKGRPSLTYDSLSDFGKMEHWSGLRLMRTFSVLVEIPRLIIFPDKDI